MVVSKLGIATVILPAVGILVTTAGPFADQKALLRPASKPPADVQKALAKYRSVRPGAKDLAIFQLDWVATLKEAKAKAAPKQRPILLIVVINSYGNMYTGHC